MGDAIFIRWGSECPSCLIAVEHRLQSIIHLHCRQARQGEVVIIPLLHRKKLFPYRSDLPVSGIHISGTKQVHRTQLVLCQKLLCHCKIHRNIAGQIQRMIDLDERILCPLLRTADALPLREAMLLCDALIATGTALPVRSVLSVAVSIVMTQPRDDLLLSQYLIAHVAVDQIRQTGADTGSRCPGFHCGAVT